ncbi:hypothetical protein [Singulisphaera sp. PoT]|uniref:hypothetical protein n=1 Tax=Singulisphaera sp. PoT TaxID=3411797 RepID=UPI003BF46D29
MRSLDVDELVELVVMIDAWVIGHGDAVQSAALKPVHDAWYLAVERSAVGGELRTFARSIRQLSAAVQDRFTGIGFECESVCKGTNLLLTANLMNTIPFRAVALHRDPLRN